MASIALAFAAGAPRELAIAGRCARRKPTCLSRERRHPLRAAPARRDVLQGVVQRELESFLARARSRERTVPRFVERELSAHLRCVILAHGFVRAHRDDCDLDRVIAFSCRGRGFRPSCGGRRMADTAAHLLDRVLPEVRIRQWVLSLPFALRYRLG